MTIVSGWVEPGFEPVRDAFATAFVTGGEVGAGAAALVEGRLVLRLRGGTTGEAGRRWEHDTLVNAFSTVKPMVAACALILADRGDLDLDAPVARYWPEFAAAGKADCRVRWLLTHQAGLVRPDEPLTTEDLLDWERVCSALAASAPAWPPGAAHGEHALYYGHLVGEVVRRIDGRPFGTFLRDELATPWGLDVHVGLDPAERSRCATLVDPGGAWAAVYRASGSPLLAALDDPPAVLDVDVVNSAGWREAQIPAVNGHLTAVALARFHAGVVGGGELDGVRVLSRASAAAMTASAVAGYDVVLGRDVTWSLGLQIDDNGAGLGGVGGSMGWASAAEGYSFAYVTRRMGDHVRAVAVEDALRAVLRERASPV